MRVHTYRQHEMMGRNRKVDPDKVKPFPPEKMRRHEQNYKSYPQWTGRRAWWS